MSAIVIVHLSDLHLGPEQNDMLSRGSSLAKAIAHECDASVQGCVVALTGDVVNRGKAEGFALAESFVRGVCEEVSSHSQRVVELLSVPGNHDVVLPDDMSLRELLDEKIRSQSVPTRPPQAVEDAVLSSLSDYYQFADRLSPGSSLGHGNHYYRAVDRDFSGHLFRFHLVNSSWMCSRGQGKGDLLFPLGEIKPPISGRTPDYSVTLMHHPCSWFRSPDVMRPLQTAIESISDMILTGHEHAGRGTTASVHGGGSYECIEGESLCDDAHGGAGAFHAIKIDLDDETIRFTTYQWCEDSSAFLKACGPTPVEIRKRQDNRVQHNALSQQFLATLNDPEMAVQHPSRGNLSLADFYVYPDLNAIKDDTEGQKSTRISGDTVVEKVAASSRMLLFGPDRCGKSSLAKQLVKDLHSRSFSPLLMSGARLRNVAVSGLIEELDELVGKQYETLKPEAYFQGDKSRRVLVLDDFHQSPSGMDRRAELIKELELHFDRVVILGADEFFFEELLGVDEADRGLNVLWNYDHYRILPFGYVRCDEYVRNWVALGGEGPEDVEDKVAGINELVNEFRRSNVIPSYPWVVMVIVQLAGSPQQVHAENGSYGYILESLITSALVKSKLNLALNGKYAWLGEFARELYDADRKSLSDGLAISFHDRHRDQYGLPAISYKELRDDFVAAGVLRQDGDMLSFRHDYTRCYFVAKELSQRVSAGEQEARTELQRLCCNLHREDAANVLIFLAHLTKSQVVLQEMLERASQLFRGVSETDLCGDVEQINNLFPTVESLILPSGDARSRRRAVQEQHDDHSAMREADEASKSRGVVRAGSSEDVHHADGLDRAAEFVAAVRTIEILGQVLRNEATARRLDAKVEIAKAVFSLGRRVLGSLFAFKDEQMAKRIEDLGERYRQLRSIKKSEAVVDRVYGHVFNMYVLSTFIVVKHVSQSVGDQDLAEVFRKVVASDSNLANRVYKLSIDFDSSGGCPVDDIEKLDDELSGKRRGADGTKSFNNLAYTVVRVLALDYMYVNRLSSRQLQSLCSRLGIERVPKGAIDPGRKRLPPGH